MKKHLLFKFLLSFCLSLFLSTGWLNAQVTLPHYEGFNYNVDDTIGIQATNWTNLNSGDSIVVTAGSLSYDGLASSTGNKVSFGGNGRDPYLTFTEATSGSVFASFIVNITDQSAITDMTDGGYFAALANGTTSYDARLWVIPSPDAASSTFKFELGVSAPTPTTETYNIGESIFVVLSYSIDNGDIACWINPMSTDFGGTAPTATLTSTDGTPNNISKFFLRQDSYGETPLIDFDELRIGTTWASVTPGDLFFSEYVEGSGGNDRAFEIFNPSESDVDLSAYSVKQSHNGDGWGIDGGVVVDDYVLPLSGTLAAGDVFVVYNSATTTTAISDAGDLALTYGEANGGKNASFTGNDALGLFKNDVLIDIIGVELATETAGPWDVAGVTGATQDHTLTRKIDIARGNTDWTSSAGTNATDSEWKVLDVNTFDDLGLFGAKTGNDILTFEFTEELAPAIIDAVAHTVAVEVAYGTVPTALVATFTLSSGATATIGVTDQESGVTANDFTSPVTYIVTAEDGQSQDWVVTVTVSATPSSNKEVTEFTVAGIVGTATIDGTNADGTITATVAYGTDLTSLKPTFTVSPYATIADTATARDFTAAQTYVVTAQDATTKDWVVTITAETATDVTIYDIQYTADASGDSPYLGELIRTSGIVTGIDGGSLWIQDGAGAWNGILVSSSTTASAVTVGDDIELVAEVNESYNLTALRNVLELTIVSSGNNLPEVTEITTLLAQDEDYEGVLVKVINAACTNADAGYGMFEVNDGSGALLIDDDFFTFTASLDEVYHITGIGHFSFSDRKILPRSAEDVAVNVAPVISGVSIDPTAPTASDDVTVLATIEDDATATNTLIVELLYGSAEGSETTSVTFTETATDNVFSGVIPASASAVYYKITANDGAAGSELTGNYSITVGINNPNGFASMNIFPNPSNGLFQVELNSNNNEEIEIEVFDVIGKMIYKTRKSGSENIVNMDLTEMNSGIYYVSITKGNQKEVSKIMIQ